MSRIRFISSIGLLTTLGSGPLFAQQRSVFVPITRAVERELSGARARATTAYVGRFFRLPGNRGFDASIDTVARLLAIAGYVEESRARPTDRFTFRIESRPMQSPAWEPLAASVMLEGSTAPLQELRTNGNMLAINSWPTPPGGVSAEVVDAGEGSDATLDRLDVRGKIVFARSAASQLYTAAVTRRGAAGVLVAQQLPGYLRPEVNRTAIQFGGIALDTVSRGWAIYLSRASQQALRDVLARGTVRARVMVGARFDVRPERTVVAEIRGSTAPDQRMVYSAHVQEPGTNDNATGVGLLAEMARVAARLVRAGTVNPQRTMTFLWGDEIRSTRRFLDEDAGRRDKVFWGMSLDMVGEATALTGGTFLIEKMPDPSAVWIRGDDQHTDWGGGPIPISRVRGHWLNDFVRQRCLARAERTGWVVRANPFEGGSDHTPFLDAGIPAVLLWHFTDQYYHTDLDRIDKVSATTLANVGNCALTAGLLMVDGRPAVAEGVLRELQLVGERELATQLRISRDTITFHRADRAREQVILEAWGDFYVEAIARVTDLVVGPSSIPLAVRKAQDAMKRRTDFVVKALP
ncbi:MAG: M28 family peptidase [Gemmatimonadales bacterium]